MALTDIEALRYIASYSDLIRSLGANAEAGRTHFEAFGRAEGRTISFDALRYVASHPDLIRAVGSNQAAGATHYINFGFNEGRGTSFDPLIYIASHRDLTQAFGFNAPAGSQHYIDFGFAEGRAFSFIPISYIAANTDLIRAFGSNTAAGLQHYLINGFAEGRATSFAALSYAASYPDLAAAFGTDQTALSQHYVTFGFNEGRAPTFDGLVYIASYSDLIQSLGADAEAGARHFVTFGVPEGRTATFNGLLYSASYSDLAIAFGTDQTAAARHFIRFGFAEGRETTFDPLAYIASYSDLIQAFGTDAQAGLQHYLTRGAAEGRTVSFSPGRYLASFSDLLTVYGADTNAATQHYINFGFAEGRVANFDEVGYLLSQSDLQQLRFGPERALDHYIRFGFQEGRTDAPYGREQVDHALSVGATANNVFDRPGDADWFLLPIEGRQQVRITLTVANPQAQQTITLFDLTGQVLAQATAQASVGTLDVITQATGTFYVGVSDNSGLTSTYTLSTSIFLIAQTGASGADSLTGTVADDQLRGLGGNDTLIGRAGDDLLEGGDGDDVLDGGAGDDRLFGGDASNVGAGNDVLTDTFGGNDQLFGQSGEDTITVTRVGSTPRSTLILDGGNGNDLIEFTSDRTTDLLTVEGGDGDDWIRLGNLATGVIDAGFNNDLVEFATLGGVQTITLGRGADYLAPFLTGGSFQIGASVRVTDFSTDGDRVVLDNYLVETLAGWDRVTNPFGTGYLQLVQRSINSSVASVLQIDIDGGGNSYQDFITFSGRLAANFTASSLGYSPNGQATPGISFVGTTRSERLFGRAGDDTLRGLDGEDTIDGQNGNDLIEGGIGNDRIDGGLGSDRLYGNDELNSSGEAGRDTLTDSLGGNDQLYGQDGNDTLTVTRNGIVPASTIVLDGGSGDDSISFTADRFTDNLSVSGGAGADQILVSGGSSVGIDAGTGNDRVVIGTRGGTHTVSLGAGLDVLGLERTGGSVPVQAAIRVTDFVVADDRVLLDDYLVDALVGWDRQTNPFVQYLRVVQSGADSVLQIDRDGGAGALPFETLVTLQNVNVASLTSASFGYALDGSVTTGAFVNGSGAADTLRGNGGIDAISGFDGADLLEGYGGNDLLQGGLGADTLDGGLGGDSLYGNNAANNGGVDGLGDLLRDTAGGNDQLYGQDGDDTLLITRLGAIPASTVLLDGGASNDSITFRSDRAVDAVTVIGGSGDDVVTAVNVGTASIDGGTGNDRVTFGTQGGSYAIALGTGADVLLPEVTSGSLAVTSQVRITDFEIGVDRVSLDAYLNGALIGFDNENNPFNGFARLIQSGADAVLQIDRDGTGGPIAFETLLTFENRQASAFTSADLGYAPNGLIDQFGVDDADSGVTAFTALLPQLTMDQGLAI